MPVAEDQQEKTEEATQSRREDFRRRGQVAQTKELSSVFVLLGSALIFWVMGRFFLQQISEIISVSYSQYVVSAARSGDMIQATIFVTKKALLVLAPLLGMFFVLAIGSSLLQTGVLYNEEALELNLDRIDPIAGFQRLLSMKALLEGLKALIKLIMVGAVAYYIIKDQVKVLPSLVNLSLQQVMQLTGHLAVKLTAGLGVFMGLIAAADYFYQRLDLEKQMRMTKQEIKEEHKSREGDPLIKARIRRIQKKMANNRMMAKVPKADVIVTNPTHIACALRYDPATMAAPQLIAKGSGLIAEKIKEIAKLNNIPILENKPLARAMFKTLKLGQTVPRELFATVAQVLSYVYKLKRKASN
jgi:flagellar biosynthesis protein FlhB